MFVPAKRSIEPGSSPSSDPAPSRGVFLEPGGNPRQVDPLAPDGHCRDAQRHRGRPDPCRLPQDVLLLGLRPGRRSPGLRVHGHLLRGGQQDDRRRQRHPAAVHRTDPRRALRRLVSQRTRVASRLGNDPYRPAGHGAVLLRPPDRHGILGEHRRPGERSRFVPRYARLDRARGPGADEEGGLRKSLTTRKAGPPPRSPGSLAD